MIPNDRETRAHSGIDLHIGRLVLDGFSLSPRERLLVKAGLETELSRLLEAAPLPDVLQAGGAMRSIRAGSISFEPGLAPHLIGERIAQAVYGSLSAGISPSRNSLPPQAAERQAV